MLHNLDFDGLGLPADLVGMLQIRNGFYSKYRGLHVFPSTKPRQRSAFLSGTRRFAKHMGRLRMGYFALLRTYLETSFAYENGVIVLVNNEHGERAFFGQNIDEWAANIMSDYAMWTGDPMTKEWMSIHGPIPPGHRLFPSHPFCMGGDYRLDNLELRASLEVLGERGYLAQKLFDVPDGANVSFQFTD